MKLDWRDNIGHHSCTVGDALAGYRVDIYPDRMGHVIKIYRGYSGFGGSQPIFTYANQRMRDLWRAQDVARILLKAMIEVSETLDERDARDALL